MQYFRQSDFKLEKNDVKGKTVALESMDDLDESLDVDLVSHKTKVAEILPDEKNG